MSHRSSGRIRRAFTLLSAVVLTVGLSAVGGGIGGSPAVADTATTAFTLTATAGGTDAKLTGDAQGFSVESADFAHGFLTRALLAERLKTLGPRGFIRIGGYSMDLVWPTFGAYSAAPAPEQAIGGTVDQADMDGLKELLDATGWKVTIGAPLKSVIDPSQVKNPARDPSPPVTMDQAVAEVVAAHATLGDDLLAVEIGNEYDNVTTLTGAQYYATMKRYHAAIKAALPDAKIKVTGPSANTARTNTRLAEFVSAVQADTTSNPQQMISELASHWYPGSHCGTSTMTIAALMSPATYTNTRTKLQGMVDIGSRLRPTIPSVINESNSASCSGMPGVSDSYATSLWSLDYLMETAQNRVGRVQFHTNTKAICGDFQPRASVNYPISYRYYGAFCAADQAAYDSNQLSAAPLYYGLWAFRQVPAGQFLKLDLADSALSQLRAYAVKDGTGTITVVLINVQDPASVTSTNDEVTLNLPSAFTSGRAVTLASSAPEGLASLDASRIALGGQTVGPDGVASGQPAGVPVAIAGKSATVSVAPGTAQILTFIG